MRADYLSDDDFAVVYRLLMPQNALIMRVCRHTGLRVGDVLALRTEQLSRQFWVTEHKTGKRRRVNLPDTLLDEIRAQAGELWAFPGRSGAPKTRQAVWKDLKRAARAMRLKVNLGTHSARKAYAVELYRRYGDMARVERALNHADVSTTYLYAMADQVHTRLRR